MLLRILRKFGFKFTRNMRGIRFPCCRLILSVRRTGLWQRCDQCSEEKVPDWRESVYFWNCVEHLLWCLCYNESTLPSTSLVRLHICIIPHMPTSTTTRVVFRQFKYLPFVLWRYVHVDERQTIVEVCVHCAMELQHRFGVTHMLLVTFILGTLTSLFVSFCIENRQQFSMASGGVRFWPCFFLHHSITNAHLPALHGINRPTPSIVSLTNS